MSGSRNVPRSDAACAVDPADHLLVAGADAADLLHRISASESRDLAAGACRHLILTDDKGSLVDAPLAAAEGDAIRLVAGPGRGPALRAWIGKWIIVEDVTVEPGPGPAWRLGRLPETRPDGLLVPSTAAGAPVLLAESWAGPEVDAATWEELQFRAGRLQAGPATAVGPNPLELGWKSLIAFDKGCYIGQEVIARLDTYEKVRRGLAVARLEAPLGAGAVLRHAGRRAGTVLESLELDEGCFAWVVVDRDLERGAELEHETQPAGTLLRAPAGPEGSEVDATPPGVRPPS